MFRLSRPILLTQKGNVCVTDLTLTAAATLGGYARDFDGTSLTEVTPLAIVAAALPLGGENAANAAIKAAYGTRPTATKSSLSKNGKTRLIQVAADQVFVVFASDTNQAEPMVNQALNGTCYTTDQTDVWVALEINGGHARAALARICQIDLHPDTFPLHAAARSTMEHMGAMVIRTGKDQFLLMSASSSAKTFLHALETSLKNVT